MVRLRNRIVCWLGRRAHEVIKELRQQSGGIIMDAQSNVKYPIVNCEAMGRKAQKALSE